MPRKNLTNDLSICQGWVKMMTMTTKTASVQHTPMVITVLLSVAVEVDAAMAHAGIRGRATIRMSANRAERVRFPAMVPPDDGGQAAKESCLHIRNTYLLYLEFELEKSRHPQTVALRPSAA